MSLSEKARIDARIRAENDLYFLATEILEWGSDKGGPTVQESFHKPLCRWIEDVGERIGGPLSITKQLLWPRYHGKTTFFSTADDIRWCLKVPDICIAVGHAQLADAAEIVMAIRSEFENKPKLKWIAPDVCFRDPEKESPLWNRDCFVIRRRHYNKTPTFQAVSPEAMPTGMHFDIWNWDDLITEKNVQTADQREKMYRAIGYASPYLPPTRLRYIKIAGTRWHIHDAYGRIIETAKKRGVVTQAHVGERVRSSRLDCLTSGMLDPDGRCWMDRYFCVEKTGEDDARISIQDLKDEMGSHTFYACMMQKPVADGMAVFKPEDVQRWNAAGDPSSEDERFKEWSPPVEGRRWRFYTAVDFNIKPDDTGDHAVVLTAAKSDKGEMAVVDMTRGHPTQAALADWIEDHCAKWKPERVFVEAAGYQETFCQLLDARKLTKRVYIPYESVPRGGVKSATKNTRIMALQPLVEAKRFWLPQERRYEPILKEMEEFTQDGKGQMDDCLDTLADIHKLGRWADKEKDNAPLPEAPRSAILGRRLLELWEQASPQGLCVESY